MASCFCPPLKKALEFLGNNLVMFENHQTVMVITLVQNT
jgi:hypothetical protein